MTWLWRVSEGPRDIPQWAYTYLVTTLKVDTNRLSQLKCVEQMNFEGDILLSLIRIFDPKAVRKATKIKDFAFLDHCPNLILYEGHMEQESGKVHIVRRAAADQITNASVT